MPPYNTVQQKKIFISYRVQDTSADTGRLVDTLKQVFNEEQIFMDIEKLEPGVDFRLALAKSLETCDVLFAVIGPEWIGTKDTNGNPRIKQPEDWVRIELETALKRDIRVIPVLVRGASLPAMEDLPESLYPLLNRQTYEISNKRWAYDTDQLINFLKKIGFIPKRTEIPVPVKKSGIGKWILYGFIGFVVLIILSLMFNTNQDNNTTKGDVLDNPVEPIPNRETGNDDNHTPSNNQNGGTNPVNEEITHTNPVNVGGAWYDATNQYTMYIEQTGATLQLKSVAVGGITTGEGVGTIEGDKMNFKVQLYNVGVISGTATVTENSPSLNGKFIITGNGASYTEDFYWTKQ